MCMKFVALCCSFHDFIFKKAPGVALQKGGSCEEACENIMEYYVCIYVIVVWSFGIRYDFVLGLSIVSLGLLLGVFIMGNENAKRLLYIVLYIILYYKN